METRHYTYLMRMVRSQSPRFEGVTNQYWREEQVITAYWKLRSKLHLEAIPKGASLFDSSEYGVKALPVVKRWYYSKIGENK